MQPALVPDRVGCALLLALVGAASGCAPCPLEGRDCANGEFLYVPLPVAEQSLEGAEVEVCRNADCWRGTQGEVPESWDFLRVEITPASGAQPPTVIDARAYVKPDEVHGLAFETYFVLANHTNIVRGDTLTASIHDSEGTELLSVEETVEDYVEQPATEGCAGPIPACRTARIDRR